MAARSSASTMRFAVLTEQQALVAVVFAMSRGGEPHEVGRSAILMVKQKYNGRRIDVNENLLQIASRES
jgi:hypothetical protein